jgi:hypothetical protein
MNPTIRIEQFTDKNVADYERLTKQGEEQKHYYYSFWHGK